MTLAVGQKLWWVWNESRRGEPAEVTVSKVGRKWATIAGLGVREYRIDINTLYADGAGYSSPGKCYLNKEIWESKCNRDRLWGELRRIVGRRDSPPEGLQTEAIVGIITTLQASEAKS